MHNQEYNHAINACILGYLLVLIALFLNYAAGDKLGICLGIVTVALKFVAESHRAGYVVVPLWVDLIALVSCVASYIAWLV